MRKENIKHYNTYTEKETYSQPKIWLEVFEKLIQEEKRIKNYLSSILEINNLQIILTGAGSSAFIGEATQGIIQEITERNCIAIPTTDIITHPKHFFIKNEPTLLVSFARSGNSPESVRTVEIANQNCDDIYHLIITCNEDGELARIAKNNTSQFYSLILPECTNDNSLAMTSSFTSMALTALTIFKEQPFADSYNDLQELIEYAEDILSQDDKLLNITKNNFERVVFLGSGPLLGIARENHLKLQELTDGQIICKHDSFLGFRHGPKAVANEKTLMVYLLSNDCHVRKYELDLIESMSKDSRAIKSVYVGYPLLEGDENNLLRIGKQFRSTNKYACIAHTLIGQLLGYFWALKLGLNPDNPSVTGAISRVVQGVTIYDEI